MLCLDQDVWVQGFGFLAGGLLAGGWKGLHVLKNKRRPSCARCSCLVPVFLTVPSASPCWVSWALADNLVSLRHRMALPSGKVSKLGA